MRLFMVVLVIFTSKLSIFFCQSCEGVSLLYSSNKRYEVEGNGVSQKDIFVVVSAGPADNVSVFLNFQEQEEIGSYPAKFLFNNGNCSLFQLQLYTADVLENDKFNLHKFNISANINRTISTIGEFNMPMENTSQIGDNYKMSIDYFSTITLEEDKTHASIFFWVKENSSKNAVKFYFWVDNYSEVFLKECSLKKRDDTKSYWDCSMDLEYIFNKIEGYFNYTDSEGNVSIDKYFGKNYVIDELGVRRKR